MGGSHFGDDIFPGDIDEPAKAQVAHPNAKEEKGPGLKAIPRMKSRLKRPKSILTFPDENGEPVVAEMKHPSQQNRRRNLAHDSDDNLDNVSNYECMIHSQFFLKINLKKKLTLSEI